MADKIKQQNVIYTKTIIDKTSENRNFIFLCNITYKVFYFLFTKPTTTVHISQFIANINIYSISQLCS